MNRQVVVRVLLLAMVQAAAACGPISTPTPGGVDSEAGVPNPASVFCEANGGRLELRTAADGSVSGACLFPDGTECEEWAFFRGECQPGGTTGAVDSTAVTPAEPLTLQVLAPEDGSVIASARSQVAGTTVPHAVVTVNDEILIAGPDGAFQTTVALEEGVNLIQVVASDDNGNEAFIELTVTYQP